MRARYWILIVVAAMACCVASSGQADSSGGSAFPLKKGAVWTYAVHSHASKATSAQIKVVDVASPGTWKLQWNGSPVEATLNADGVLLRELRHVGAAGLPKIVPMADLRWAGATTWKDATISGCSPYDIHGTREADEAIDVPAGHFNCVQIVNLGLVKETYWLARGTGIVKKVYADPRGPEEWTLQSYSEKK